MINEPLISRMLAARHALRRTNPELLSWSRGQWDAWLRTQRGLSSQQTQSPLLAVATLTCLEDLPLHVGLMQLLAMGASRCTVVLTLPTDATARIARARARREGWGSLVAIRVAADFLVDTLPPSALLAVFPFPTVLPAQAIASFVGQSGSSGAQPNDIMSGEGDAFLGVARDYAPSASNRAFEERLTAALRLVACQPADRLPAVPEVFDSDSCSGGSWTNRIDFSGSSIKLPSFAEEDELVVSAWPEEADPVVIARRRGALCEREILPIRVPPSLLTTDPTAIRLESRKADGSTFGSEFLLHVPPSGLEPWMISAFLNRGGGGNPVIRAFAAGTGCRIAYAEDEPETLSDVPVVWGVLRESDRILAQAKAQSLYFFYIDHAYFNRGHGRTYRITRNRYEAGPVRKCPTDRLSEMEIETLPWRRSGRDIIVCPPTEYFMQAHDCADWLESTLEKLRSVTDRPIVLRAKPKPGETVVPLPEALQTAHALVTHSSNVAIEAACLGTPVFVAPASAAMPIGRTDLSEIEAPVYPDRTEWLAHLAYNQFSFEEIADGRAWRMLLELEERDLA